MERFSRQFHSAIAFGILTIFGSEPTYVNNTFQNIKFIKNKLGNRLNDISLNTFLKFKITDP